MDRLGPETKLDLMHDTFRNLAVLALVLCSCVFVPACRSGKTGTPDTSKRTPVLKPWTQEAVEAHEYLWFESSTGRRGFVIGPAVVREGEVDFLTTKQNDKVRMALSEVTVLDSVDEETLLEYAPRDPNAPGPPVAQNVAVSVLALWGAVLLFLPTILLIVLLA